MIYKMPLGVQRGARLFSLLVALVLTGPLACAEQQPGAAGFVAVQGHASVKVVPDEIHFTIGISTTEPTAQGAYNVVESRMQQAMQKLKQLTIAEHDIQAVALSLTPVIDYKQRNKIIGHKASRDIQVKVTDISVYAKAIGQLATIDEIRFSQVRLSSSEREALMLEALELAYDNAEQKAQHLLKRSGQKLGRLIEISEQAAHMPSPTLRHSAAMAIESADAATVSRGSISISANVQARFEIE